MREDLNETLERFRCHASVPLPDGSTDVDLLVEDLRSSTVLIAELKWYRKPSTYRERLRADADFEDGYERQIATIRAYCGNNPKWLKDRKVLARSLKEYENVYYLLIGRDQWAWFDPRDCAAVVEFEQFRLAVGRNATLHDAIQEVLRYEWLPVEDQDFLRPVRPRRRGRCRLGVRGLLRWPAEPPSTSGLRPLQLRRGRLNKPQGTRRGLIGKVKSARLR